MSRGFHTIHNRLFLLFLFCMLSLLLIVSALYYKRTTDQFHAKVGDIAQKNVSQTVDYFDLLLTGYDSLTKSISGNFDLQRLLKGQNTQDSALRIINQRTITNMLGAIYYSREDLIGIHVLTYSGTVYNYGNFMNVIDPNYMDTDWFRELKQGSGKMEWLGVYPNSLIDQMTKRPVYAFGRELYDLTDQKPIGVVLIETDPTPIQSALSNLSLGPHSQVYIVSKEGRVVASAANTETPLPSFSDIPAPAKERDVMVDQRPDQLVVAAKPAMADWKVVSITPDQDLNVELNQTKRFLVMVVSVLIVLSTVLATFVSRTFSSPVKRLIQEMKQVEKGNFKGMLKVKSYYEINVLVSSFNQMVHRMDDLIERVKLSSISEKNAQLQALQSQVNPHFLYNTLDMMYWMLDEQKNERLGKVVLSLSQMLRYSSYWEEGAKVTLQEELEQIQHYLTIIESRLEGRVSAHIHVEDRWLELLQLPKMTLQPIIENAVKHGLEPLKHPGVLNVYTEVFDRNLQVIIEDNGTGMDEETLKQLTASLRAGERAARSKAKEADDGAELEQMGRLQSVQTKERRGIGLQNLHRRLILMFGESYGLRIQSKQGAGTKVMISMPLPPAGGE